MISLIIPLYNVGRYIIECLESLENQIYKDFEVIIVNDECTDNSLVCMEEYLKKSKLNITIINQKNAGVSAARNKGIEHAKGDFICFVDADDMIYPNYLSEMLFHLEGNGADVVFCKSEIGHETLKYKDVSALDILESEEVRKRDTITALRNFLYGNLISGACTMLVKSEVLRSNCLRFREGYRYSEDLNFVWKVISKSSNIISLNTVLYIYRTRNNSAMSKINSSRLDGLELMKELELYFQKASPLFFNEFRKYGIARWVWATLWQMTLGSRDYKEFKMYAKDLDVARHFRRLLDFPNKKVQISSVTYLISPLIYYLVVKFIVSKKIQRKFNKMAE